jgi:glutamate carboxypeptidase
MSSDAMRIEGVVELLKGLVEIESPTGNADALIVITDRFASEMEKRGGRVEPVPAPGYGVHLLVDFFTTGERPLLVVGHLDTVHPRGTLEYFPWKREGDRLFGPGVFDMKGSWAAVAGALDLLSAEGVTPRPLRLLLTCDEEVGAPHSRTLIEKEGRRARGALVLEPPLPGGTMKTSRKGMAVYRIGVKGHSAHSGIEPEKGASATHAIVRVLAKILELEDPQTGVTINVGVIGGGTAGNVVADAAEAHVELRFWRREDGERGDENIRRIAAEGARDPRCSIEVIGGVSRWAMEPNAAGRVLEAAAVTAAQELGRELGSGRTGGSSDGQFLSAVGCPVLDGLGIDGGGAHTLEEHILLSDLPFRIALYARLFSRL